MLKPESLKAKPADNYEDLKRQFFALKKLCELKFNQCSAYSRKLAEYDRESLIARNEALESEREMNAQLTAELEKANERVAELEQLNLELAANVEACCELTDMDMGAAIERLFEIDNTESTELLNKFAIEKNLKVLDDLLEEIQCSVVVPKRYEQFQDPYLEGIKHCIQFIECQSKQLRKEQDK